MDKDGNRTDIWKASDKVYVGQADPRYRGIANTMFMWKGLTVNVSASFYWGGKRYNSTIIDRVEVGRTTLMAQNVDARALYDRWQKPGISFHSGNTTIVRPVPLPALSWTIRCSRFSLSGFSINGILRG